VPDLRELAVRGRQPTLQFDYLTRRRSFDELIELAAEVYARAPRTTHTDPELWRAFPRGYVGCWIDDRLRGCIQLWPLDRRRAADFLVGARSERELGGEDLVSVCNSPHTVYYFSGLLLAREWQGRGMAVHLLAESMSRWYRDLPWRAPIAFAALGTSPEGLAFIEDFGMREVRPASETADGHPLFARRFEDESELFLITATAQAAADRKGRLMVEEEEPHDRPAGGDGG
jgi:GNAT superfamily N-acetyltransferase